MVDMIVLRIYRRLRKALKAIFLSWAGSLVASYESKFVDRTVWYMCFGML